MAFRVEIAPRAFSDLDGIAAYINERGSNESARGWFNGIIEAIRDLSDMPSRCPVAEESEALGQQVHLLLHGKRNRTYKVYYSIHEETQTGPFRPFPARLDSGGAARYHGVDISREHP